MVTLARLEIGTLAASVRQRRERKGQGVCGGEGHWGGGTEGKGVCCKG